MNRPIALRIEDIRDPSGWPMACRGAVTAGFDGVELPEQALEQAALPAADIRVVAVVARCATCEIEPAIEHVRHLLERAAAVQARVLNLRVPPLRSPDGDFARYQDALNFTYRLLHELRFDAESTGVALAIEAATDGCLMSPAELRDTIDRANSWAVGACIDVERVARVAFPADWLTTLRRRVHCVRVGVSDQVDLQALAAAMDDIPYEGPIVVSGIADPAGIRSRLAGTWPN